jgi:hypothetical protein
MPPHRTATQYQHTLLLQRAELSLAAEHDAQAALMHYLGYQESGTAALPTSPLGLARAAAAAAAAEVEGGFDLSVLTPRARAVLSSSPHLLPHRSRRRSRSRSSSSSEWAASQPASQPAGAW